MAERNGGMPVESLWRGSAWFRFEIQTEPGIRIDQALTGRSYPSRLDVSWRCAFYKRPRIVPQISMLAPVIIFASGEARNTAACATSIGCPIPIGIWRSSVKRFTEVSKISAVLLHQLIGDAARTSPHPRPDRPRRDSIHTHLRRILLGERLGEVQHARFERTVIREARLGLLREVGAGVDHTAGAALARQWHNRAARAHASIRLMLNPCSGSSGDVSNGAVSPTPRGRLLMRISGAPPRTHRARSEWRSSFLRLWRGQLQSCRAIFCRSAAAHLYRYPKRLPSRLPA